MQRISFTIVATVVLAACNNSASNSDSTSDTTAQSGQVVVDSAALGLSGIYYGYLPCADCKGISTFLQLKPDMTYRTEETYYGKSDSAFVTSGTWKIDNGKIALTHNGKAGNSFLPEGDKIWQLDHQGNRISGNLGDKYVLSRQPVADNKHFAEKKEAGVDFIANGNEPFWSLEIDKGKNFVFNQPGLEKPDTIAYAEATVNNGVRSYQVQDGKTTLELKITPQFCNDGMSDFVYEYRVELNYKKKRYAGCGRLLNEL